MPPTCKRRPGGGGAADASLASDGPQHSHSERDNPDPIADLIAPDLGAHRPACTKERLAELGRILERTVRRRQRAAPAAQRQAERDSLQ